MRPEYAVNIVFGILGVQQIVLWHLTQSKVALGYSNGAGGK